MMTQWLIKSRGVEPIKQACIGLISIRILLITVLDLVSSLQMAETNKQSKRFMGGDVLQASGIVDIRAHIYIYIMLYNTCCLLLATYYGYKCKLEVRSLRLLISAAVIVKIIRYMLFLL